MQSKKKQTLVLPLSLAFCDQMFFALMLHAFLNFQTLQLSAFLAFCSWLLAFCILSLVHFWLSAFGMIIYSHYNIVLSSVFLLLFSLLVAARKEGLGSVYILCRMGCAGSCHFGETGREADGELESCRLGREGALRLRVSCPVFAHFAFRGPAGFRTEGWDKAGCHSRLDRLSSAS